MSAFVTNAYHVHGWVLGKHAFKGREGGGGILRLITAKYLQKRTEKDELLSKGASQY
jgi:hypothetical protein